MMHNANAQEGEAVANADGVGVGEGVEGDVEENKGFFGGGIEGTYVDEIESEEEEEEEVEVEEIGPDAVSGLLSRLVPKESGASEAAVQEVATKHNLSQELAAFALKIGQSIARDKGIGIGGDTSGVDLDRLLAGSSINGEPPSGPEQAVYL
jgi:hypothetical protein